MIRYDTGNPFSRMETAFIQEILEKILTAMNVRASINGVSALQGGSITKIAVTTEEPHTLIGNEGKTLFAINHVIKKVYEQAVSQGRVKPVDFLIDVNNYQENRIRDLKSKADMMAERARFFKSNIELPPMNPYERMLVHSFFSETVDISTESTGSGKERRVVLKYKDAQE